MPFCKAPRARPLLLTESRSASIHFQESHSSRPSSQTTCYTEISNISNIPDIIWFHNSIQDNTELQRFDQCGAFYPLTSLTEDVGNSCLFVSFFIYSSRLHSIFLFSLILVCMIIHLANDEPTKKKIIFF